MKQKKQGPVKVRYSFIRIMSVSDLSRRQLPFMSAVSANPGPTLWITGCIHGDEVGGIVVIQEIFKRIRARGLIRGKVFALPLMNPMGFETASRNIIYSMEDLNRSFPGTPSGTLAQRIADKIFTTITETGPDLVIDLHNDWIKSIPYCLIDPVNESFSSGVYDIIPGMAEKTGLLIVCDSETIPGSFSYNLIKNGIPSFIMELGESYVVNEKNIELGIGAILNVMTYFGMTDPGHKSAPYPLTEEFLGTIYNYTTKPLSSSSGIIRFMEKPGNRVKKGQTIARIYNTFGKLQEAVISQSDGIILGHSDLSAVFPGLPVIASAV